MKNRKRLAGACLVIAACLYIVSIKWAGLSPAMAYLNAFAEAAMIGGIADWFAVTALFRHPLGIPIPHTSIIARNKSRIGHSLSRFIRNNFLSGAYVHASVERADLAGKWLQWLQAPAHREKLADGLCRAIRYALRAGQDDSARRFIEATLLRYASRLAPATLIGRVLAALKEDGQHQALLDDTLTRLAHWLESPVHQRWLKRQLTQVIFRLINPRFFGREISLNRFAGWIANERLIERFSRLLTEVSQDPDHPVRRQLDQTLDHFIERTRNDPVMIARLDRIRDELLSNAPMQRYIQRLWGNVLLRWEADLDSSTSHTKASLLDFIDHYVQVLDQNPAARDWINTQAITLIPPLVASNSARIDAYIRHYIDQLSARDVVEQIEHNVGNDLQYIRINGTLVGGLVGVAIHALTQLALLF
ncbi:DUF445 domain-containing protein [Larsenimonas rhizosphaerae]|uniref:DUF445 domain-containing protein n=1 Tax=Larsenimonas rhizosphaerae TaxID=2944682 RepID=A0AA41ZLG8_9GAMM|nr:DUF445 domain-containing protein [Larsenimonas rhizosphaerae]MCX2522975.1 DUF445 domain-containing protein [Larsenimonas rhizosphaerae]